ncbi:MAG: MBL fold metallo-hydrolase [Syntrophobacteraceae bacterium]
MSRREALKISGLALGGLASAIICPKTGKAQAAESCPCSEPDIGCAWYNPDKYDYTAYPESQRYSYFEGLPKFYPFYESSTTVAPLGSDEMRITFMGSMIPAVRRAQQEMSIFVEVGWDADKKMPLDQFVFDCGSGVCGNYGAMNVGYGRMDKVFLAHLHGDHMSDLTHIYCFGPSGDRKTPLYVWGPSPSGVRSPAPPRRLYNDGTNSFCQLLREACRWHSESFSFQTTMWPGYPSQKEIQKKWGLPCRPTPVSDDPWGDGYCMVPIELDWTKKGRIPGDNIAYLNKSTGVKITHFPVIHTRRGSIGYKLEWWPPGTNMKDPKQALSMIYTSDTKPETNCLEQACNKGHGVTVFIHEMVVPPNIWSMKTNETRNFTPGADLPPDSDNETVQDMTTVQNSSHTPQGAFGYLMTRINPRPRLTVATHFPVADDTVACAMNSVQEHFPNNDVYQGNTAPDGLRDDPIRMTWSFDLMVITASKDTIIEQQGYVSNFGFSPSVNLPSGTPYPPKYHDENGDGDPYAQIDRATEIDSCENGACNFREDGY